MTAREPPFSFLAAPLYNRLVTPDPFFKEIERKGKKQVHFIGIGGIGMSSLARWFLAQKWAVSGSDVIASEITAELQKEGVNLVLGHGRGLAGMANLVIRSQAVLPTDPEYREASVRQIPIFTYPEIMGTLSRRYSTLAIAGAHGKSTTTSMLALAAVAGKLDPTVILGTKLKEFNGKNFRYGQSKWLVLEADEYGRAFLNYSPAAAVVTNIDREHLDTYRGLAGIKRAFLEFMSRVREGGALVLNGESANLISLKPQINKLARRKKLKVFWYSAADAAGRKIRPILKVPGYHNVSNASAAYSLACKFLKIPENAVLQTLSRFRGSWRRAEYRGSYKLGAVSYDVYDDYAHHPTEIKASLKAFREKFKYRDIICVFQPHQAERLKKLFPEFKKSFADANAILVLPEYRVTGREEKPSPYTAKALATAVKKLYPKKSVAFLDNPQKLSRNVIREHYLGAAGRNHKATVIMMGAGNIVDYTPNLL